MLAPPKKKSTAIATVSRGDEGTKPKRAPPMKTATRNIEFPPGKRIRAAIAVAKLALNNLSKTLADRNCGLREIQTAVVPVFGIEWTRETVIGVKTTRINNILKRIKNSPAGPTCYARLEKLWLDSFINPIDPFPVKWVTWKNLLVKFGIYSTRPYSVWMFMVRELADIAINDPFELAEFRRDQLYELKIASELLTPLGETWQAARIAFSKKEGFPANNLTDMRVNQNSLIRTVSGKTLENSGPARKCRRLRHELALPSNYTKLGPAARIRALAASGAKPEQLNNFVAAGCQLNVLKQVGKSLKSVRSGIRCYLSFCSLMQLSPFPPSEGIVLQWSSIFGSTATFGLYVQHLLKACQLVGATTEWLSASIRSIARGLKRNRDISFRFHNFADFAMLLELLALEGWRSPFVRAAMLSFLFSLRVPSETLLLRRAYGNEPLLSFCRQETKARIGVRISNSVNILVAKFSYRKNIPSGCILRRPCICAPKTSAPHPFCPVHILWHHIRRTTLPGEHLFPELTQRNFNPTLKKTFAKASIPDAERFSSHCFRRGATQALKNCEATPRTLVGSGVWNSKAVLGYVDLTQDESAELSTLLLNPSLSSDSEDDTLPLRAVIRKRILRLPQLVKSLPEHTITDDENNDDDLTSEYSSGEIA